MRIAITKIGCICKSSSTEKDYASSYIVAAVLNEELEEEEAILVVFAVRMAGVEVMSQCMIEQAYEDDVLVGKQCACISFETRGADRIEEGEVFIVNLWVDT